MINFLSGDMFKLAEPDSVLVHAVNCRGVWGKGVAAQFKKRFPKAFLEYQRICNTYSPDELVGSCFVISEEEYDIACLFTSRGYDQEVDPPAEILKNTGLALSQLFYERKMYSEYPEMLTKFYSPKFNAGLFKVPWEATHEILNKLDSRITGIEWNVCTLD